jgi:tetratricopeptide (TPR) repeat protein
VRTRFPDFAEAYGYEAMALRQTNRIEDAEPLIERAIAEFPDAWRLFTEYVHCAHGRRQGAEAVRRSEMMVERFPDRPESYRTLVDSLLRDGQLDRAETTIQPAIARFPDHPGVLWAWALTASRRHAWREAVLRWETARARCPDAPLIGFSFGEFRVAMQLEGLGPDGLPLAADADDLQPAVTPAPIAAAGAQDDLGKFFLQFEALGDNCEFGLVQRAAGVEPLGLLRWASIEPDELALLLETRLAGIGEPQNTRLRNNIKSEYFLFDKRYFRMHTFISVSMISQEELMPKMLSRLRFLKDKLIEDLTDGNKTFVYKRYGDPLTRAQMDRLLAAIRSYGPGRLLLVQKPDHPDKNLTVEPVGDRLVLGYLSRLAHLPQGVQSYFHDWVALCRKAASLT